MELKEAKCPNCGGSLKLNPELEKGMCIYCGTEIIVAEAIQKFKGEISGIATTKNSMIRAYHLIEDGDYDAAMKTFRHVIDTDPTNGEAYYGMYRASVEVAEYYKRLHSGEGRTLGQYVTDLSDAVNKYGKRAIQYASEENKAEYENDVNNIIEIIKTKTEEVERMRAAESSGGCYVATSVYGSYDCPEVWVLRRYRDYTLSESSHGRLFIKLYYAISPTIVKLFGDNQWFKEYWKSKLDRMVNTLKQEGVEDTPYQDRIW